MTSQRLKINRIITLMMLLLASTSFAQVPMDSTDFPLAGTTRYRAVDTLPASSLAILPAGGANLNWDFTQSIAVTKLDTINYLDPNTTSLPFGFVYPTANYAVQILPENTSVFVENTGASHVWLGVSNPAFPVPFGPQREFLKFNMNYGDQDTSMFGNDLMFPFDVTMTSFDSSRVKNETTEYFDYDAWGSFVDNNGGSVNALRRKHLTISTDSIWGWTSGAAVFVTAAVDTTQGYTWFGEGTGVLANVDVDGSGNIIYADFFSNSLLTTRTQPVAHDFGMKLFPNPTTGSFTIQFDNSQSGSLIVYDQRGQQVMQQDVHGHTTKINIRSLKAGMYVYRLVSRDGGSQASGKLSLIH